MTILHLIVTNIVGTMIALDQPPKRDDNVGVFKVHLKTLVTPETVEWTLVIEARLPQEERFYDF